MSGIINHNTPHRLSRSSLSSTSCRFCCGYIDWWKRWQLLLLVVVALGICTSSHKAWCFSSTSFSSCQYYHYYFPTNDSTTSAIIISQKTTTIQNNNIHHSSRTAHRHRSIQRKFFVELYGLLDDNHKNNNSNNNSSQQIITTTAAAAAKTTTIPPDILQEITRAESNTPAAQSRNRRILFYFTFTLLGVSIAFFNAFLSSLRYGEGSPSTELSYYGFDWVQSNWLTGFFFTNKIGGGIGLLSAGLAGTLAEVEIRSKSEAIDKIWEEMQRRQSLREGGGEKGGGGSKNKYKSLSSSSKREKKRRRLSPLEEISLEEYSAGYRTSGTDSMTVMMSNNNTTSTERSSRSLDINNNDNDNNSNGSNDDDGGILGAISRFYKQADNMAASQALLLNKELEDRGILEKITDETGLRVVGKQKKEDNAE